MQDSSRGLLGSIAV